MLSHSSLPRLSRRGFIKSSFCLAGAVPLLPGILGAAKVSTEGASTAQQLGLSELGRRQLAHLANLQLLSIEPIVVAPDGNINHVGWPISTQLSNGLAVVVYQRATGGHALAGKHAADLPPAGRYAVYSQDGKTWLPHPPFTASARLGPPDGMHCIGVVKKPDGRERVIVVTSGAPRQVLCSDDGGESWREIPAALNGLLNGAVHCGPCMINHPDFGLVAAFGQEKNGKARRNWLLRTRDAGETWQESIWRNTQPARSVEPALATWGPGHMAMVSREYVSDFATNPDGFYCYTQHVHKRAPGTKFEKVQFTTARTNIAGNAAFGQDCHDTPDLIYNPVSKRIECLQSHRRGGGEGRTGRKIETDPEKRINTLNLWSIDPDELLAGSSRWRFECTLVERADYSMNGARDGMHPGASIVDVKRGVQHIFIYAGWRRRPASVFRVSRSLDTNKLAFAWRQGPQAAS